MYKNFLLGKVHITGHVRQRELDAWAKSWPDLVVTYGGIIDQYPVTFLNADGTAILDKKGDAYVQWVDQGAKPYNPITAGDIETPTLESTAQYDFTFANWNGIDVNVTAPVTVTAVYNSTVRTYTVRWLKKAGVVVQTKANVPYGTGVEYEGEWPTLNANGVSLNLPSVLVSDSLGYQLSAVFGMEDLKLDMGKDVYVNHLPISLSLDVLLSPDLTNIIVEPTSKLSYAHQQLSFGANVASHLFFLVNNFNILIPLSY